MEDQATKYLNIITGHVFVVDCRIGGRVLTERFARLVSEQFLFQKLKKCLVFVITNNVLIIFELFDINRVNIF